MAVKPEGFCRDETCLVVPSGYDLGSIVQHLLHVHVSDAQVLGPGIGYQGQPA
jgi:hypothetical protein